MNKPFVIADSEDMPRPDDGWSREVIAYRNALVAPPLKDVIPQQCGVFPDGGLDLCRNSVTYRAHKKLFVPLTEYPQETEVLKGRHMWGGQMHTHFGHLVLESTGRLWAATQSQNAVHKAESLVFIPRFRNQGTELSDRVKAIFETFGVSIPIRVLDKPTIVEDLLVPGQAMGFGPISSGTPEYRQMLAEMADRIAPADKTKIYISRTKLSGAGDIYKEEVIEENMARAGYHVFHPQEHSLTEQLAHYKGATHIIGVDGSAFHVAALVARPDQNIGIILRRNHRIFTIFVRQYAGLRGKAPNIINALSAVWNGNIGARFGIGEVSFDELETKLKEGGFLAADFRWEAPSPDVVQQEIQDMVDAANERGKLKGKDLKVSVKRQPLRGKIENNPKVIRVMNDPMAIFGVPSDKPAVPS